MFRSADLASSVQPVLLTRSKYVGQERGAGRAHSGDDCPQMGREELRRLAQTQHPEELHSSLRTEDYTEDYGEAMKSASQCIPASSEQPACKDTEQAG